jgi:hypothetical protein
MQGPLAERLDPMLLERIARVSPDELAPSLGLVVAALAEGRTDLPYADTGSFLRLTQLTGNFKEILRAVHSALSSKSSLSLFLDLDMGSGKTHLLTLILHLYAACPEDFMLYLPLLEEYIREGCYNPQLAKDTVVLAFDLRTPGEVYRFPLELLARQLRRTGVREEVVVEVRKLAESGLTPDPRRLAEMIPDDKHVIVLVDELYHALIFAQRSEDLSALEQFISFLNFFLNYRRQRAAGRSGLVVLVASARRDYERWLTTFRGEPERRRTAELADAFMSQLQRLAAVVPTEWLGLEDAKQIIGRRLNCSYAQVFHESFDRLIARVIKADTDVPQAHHLRSLIKALAIFALNAVSEKDPVVTPARFSSEIIDTLILDPEYKNLANIYRSHYDAAVEEARKRGKREVLLAVNALFALTITGSEEKLIQMVRLAKTSRGPAGEVPLVTAKELEDILAALGVDQKAAADALAELPLACPVTHSVRTAEGGIAYFVAPTIDVRAYFLRLCKRLEDEYFAERRDEVAEVLKNVLEMLPQSQFKSKSAELKPVDDFKGVRGLNPDKLYVLIYAEQDWLRELVKAPTERRSEQRLRAVSLAENFLENKRALNVVVVVPNVSDGVLRDLARYQASLKALGEVLEKYLIPMEQGTLSGEDKATQILRRLLEVELDDVKRELGVVLTDAVRALQRALRVVLSKALRYDGNRVVEHNLPLEEINVGFTLPHALSEVREKVEEEGRAALSNISEKLVKAAKDAAGFVDISRDAAAILCDYVSDELRKKRSVKVYHDVRVYKIKGRSYYIPSSLIEETLPQVKKLLEGGKLPEGYKVRTLNEEGVTTFELVETQQPPPQPPQPTVLPSQPPTLPVSQALKELPLPPPPPPPGDKLEQLEREIRERSAGRLKLTLKFQDQEDVANIINHLRALKKLIEDYTIEAAG